MKPSNARQRQFIQKEVQCYPRFQLINGDHDFKKAVPGGYVEYQARLLRGGRVAYFNFDLAEEMGLISAGHEHRLNPELESAILETFPLQIINEYDILHKTPIPKKDILPGKYMATRYLQLQHPSRVGRTSGDGRSIWNGQIKHRGTTWDITSCGTGSTCLSPAAAILGRIPRTGDPRVAYGCGLADTIEGMSAACMSEIFHQNGIATERSLAIIEFEDGNSINVRAGKCLLRPSHFFHHLRQGNFERLKGAVDYFIRRQIENREWPELARAKEPYFALAERIAIEFARMAAKFENEYIFVWMDWDGDNILANGGIIDYGSVRQFGLYHQGYRYDDGDRWSTTIPEQRLKARAMVQSFVQIAHFLHSGRKRNIRRFRSHAILKKFDREFQDYGLQLLLYKSGFDEKQQRTLLEGSPRKVRQFKKAFSYFEKMSSARTYKVSDGITRDAQYCMRELVRELPGRLLAGKMRTDDSSSVEETCADFMSLIVCGYTTRNKRRANFARQARIREYLHTFRDLVSAVAAKHRAEVDEVLRRMAVRATYLNPRDRITGSSILTVTERILRARARGLRRSEVQELIENFIRHHTYSPEATRLRSQLESKEPRRKSEKYFYSVLRLVEIDREGL